MRNFLPSVNWGRQQCSLLTKWFCIMSWHQLKLEHYRIKILFMRMNNWIFSGREAMGWCTWILLLLLSVPATSNIRPFRTLEWSSEKCRVLVQRNGDKHYTFFISSNPLINHFYKTFDIDSLGGCLCFLFLFLFKQLYWDIMIDKELHIFNLYDLMRLDLVKHP